jgi:hypothetical protein
MNEGPNVWLERISKTYHGMRLRRASFRVTECSYESWESRPTGEYRRTAYRAKEHRELDTRVLGGMRNAGRHNSPPVSSENAESEDCRYTISIDTSTIPSCTYKRMHVCTPMMER